MSQNIQRELEASEARFRTLIEKSADGILVVRGDGILDYVNPAAETLLGRSAAALVGGMFGQPLTAGETTEIDVWPATRHTEASESRTSPYESPPFRTAEMRVVEIDWNGQPAFLATLRDISERKEAVRRRDEFLAMLAHELRNPLAPILNAVHLMHLHPLPTAELEHARAIIERQGHHLTRLLDDLLDLSRVAHGKVELRKQQVNLHEIVADAVQSSRSLIEGGSHQLTLSLDEGQPLRVEADPTRLTQVVVNLLNNAAKYTALGGRIELSLHGEQSQAVLRVKDSGMGIPPEMLASIFEPFIQLKTSLDRAQGGLGIGLALVRHLVELHGGTIAAHSDGPGQGSEFVVRLPLDSRLAPATATSSRQKVVPRRILLIEDNADGRAMLMALLRLLGHHVEEASDGLRGLDAIHQQAPEVALVDVGLPGLDGYELARRVRAAPDGDKVLLVAVTGYGQPEDRRRALEAGFNAHLVKPVDMDELAKILAELPP